MFGARGDMLYVRGDVFISKMRLLMAEVSKGGELDDKMAKVVLDYI